MFLDEPCTTDSDRPPAVPMPTAEKAWRTEQRPLAGGTSDEFIPSMRLEAVSDRRVYVNALAAFINFKS